MAEVVLDPIRAGFDWSCDIEYPAGFLAGDESVRMKLRRFVGSSEAFACDSIRTGDTVSLSLAGAVTDLMTEGTYIGEAVIYKPLDAAQPEIPLTTNRFLVDCDRSPSE